MDCLIFIKILFSQVCLTIGLVHYHSYLLAYATAPWENTTQTGWIEWSCMRISCCFLISYSLACTWTQDTSNPYMGTSAACTTLAPWAVVHWGSSVTTP